VCIPTFNRGRYIETALNSAIGQTYDRLEIIVLDDASTDDTVDLVKAYDDSRIRLHINPRRLGQNANRNRALSIASGELIKFLDSDDRLDSECVAKMADIFADDPTVGLVFSRRRIALEGPRNGTSQEWLANYGELHTQFAAVERLNDGRTLFAQWLAAGLHDNWIGEPSAVMVRRDHLQASGGFSFHVQQRIDSDLWMRLLVRSLVGFADEVLVTYRRGHESEDVVNSRTRRDWIDRLWNLEGLATDEELRRGYPALVRLLRDERMQAWRTAARLGRLTDERSVPVGPYVRYLRYRTLSRLGLPSALFAKLPQPAEPSRNA
jgi:glycosyltransferase involved in cell wall biosynthesis